MIGLLKKTRWKIEGKAFVFFQKVFLQLPPEFRFLADGLERRLYRSFSLNHSMKGNFYSITFDSSQSDRSKTKGKHFELENIIIKQDGQSFPLNITIYEGLWIGFEIEKNILDFNDFQIELSSFKKNMSKFSSNSTIENLVSGLNCKQLDLKNLAEIEIEGKTFYQIKDLEDGNYIAIDNKAQVFSLNHDPYKIELINRSLRQFVDEVNGGTFNLEKYLL